MLSAESHLEAGEREFLTTGGIVHLSVIELEPLAFDVVGTLPMSLAYPSGDAVHVSVTVDVGLGYPNWLAYGFQCVRSNGHTIFRYDNAPHHPGLETFPDHKHVGARERAIPHPRPTLPALVRGILEIVEEPTRRLARYEHACSKRLDALTEPSVQFSIRAPRRWRVVKRYHRGLWILYFRFES